jgi:hypothetical protein
VRIAVDPTMTRLLRDVSAGIRVLQVRDGILLSEKQILERARNIVMGLIGNYRIETLDGDGLDAMDTRGEGRGAVHGDAPFTSAAANHDS